eukprot:GFYU01046917.1.p1 GENE.GFYU01046917.1~~GFYU01046917.1.p1  ORF type:complete len:149 (+),score=29.28 GFYU01046917.1:44-490(+)
MIRPYQSSDKDTVIDIWYQASLVAHHFLKPEFVEKARTMIRDVFMDMAETHVYEVEGKVVGFISILNNDTVGGLFVYPGQQRSGIGRELMQHAIDLKKTLELDVFKLNPIGRAFYKKFGFEEVEESYDEDAEQWQIRLRYTSATEAKA